MLNVKEYVTKKKEELSKIILTLPKKPTIEIIQVNEDPASNSYIKGKIKDLEEVGFNYIHTKLPIDISESDLLKRIEESNNNDAIDGFIVQLPLPPQLDETKVKQAVAPKKDVDGFNPISTIDPATPKGIVTFLEDNNFDFKGKNALVIGRSNIVGKPMANLLLNKDMNVTVVHSKTSKEDFKFYIEHADLIVISVGKQALLKNEFNFKKDTIVIDVGINRGEDGKLHGDCEPNLNVFFQTPVPGGVGLLTRLALLLNLIEVSKK